MQNQILSQTSTAAKTTPVISLVIPVFNEMEVLPLLFERVRKVMQGLKLDYEMVMVDDGSKDSSADFWFVKRNKMHALGLSFCPVTLAKRQRYRRV